MSIAERAEAEPEQMAGSVQEMYLLHLCGASLSEVASHFGVSSSHVGQLFRRIGLPHRGTDARVPNFEELFDAHERGATPSDIASKYGLPADQIVGILRAAGIPADDSPPDEHSNQTQPELTDEELERVHTLYWDGADLGELARPRGFSAGDLIDSFEEAGMPVLRPSPKELAQSAGRRNPASERRKRQERARKENELETRRKERQQEMRKRAEEMYASYKQGATLNDVAEEFGVTRERVRQVFRAAGIPLRSVADAYAMKRQLQLDRRDEILNAFHRLGEEQPVARELGVSQSVVREVVHSDPSWLKYQKRRPAKKKYTTEELLSCLREAHDALGGILTVQNYRRFAGGRTFADGRPWPTNQTFQLRFGSWRGGLLAAGLSANPASPIGGQHLFDEGQCIDALRHAGRTLGKRPTTREYDLLARESQGGLPSQATVRHRLGGTWLEALVKAGF